MEPRLDGLSKFEVLFDRVIDTTTRIILETIGGVGYVVELTYSTGHVFIATNETTGERFIVRAADPYRAACELAVKVGIDLEG